MNDDREISCDFGSMASQNHHEEERRRNGIYWKDQKDDLDGVTILTPYLQQFFSLQRRLNHNTHLDLRPFDLKQSDKWKFRLSHSANEDEICFSVRINYFRQLSSLV